MIILLQNEARVITKRGSFFITKRGKGYNKTRQVLQNAAIITKRGSTLGGYDMQRYAHSQSKAHDTDPK